MDDLLINPVLSYVKAFRLRGDNESLKLSALGKFAPALLAEAKKMLWDKCDLANLGFPLTNRRTTEKRSQATADLEDILTAFSKLDESDNIPLIFCEAGDLVKLPPIVTDPVCEIINDNRISLLNLEKDIKDLTKKFNDLSSSISNDKSHRSYAAAAHPGSNSSIPGEVSLHNVNPVKPVIPRNQNVILFGLKESDSLIDLKNQIDDMLTFLVGSHVPLNNLYRLGRNKPDASSAQRPRPVLLTFSSPMDRRMVLSCVRKLKRYSITGLYLRPDLTLEERKRRMASSNVSSNIPPTATAPLNSAPAPLNSASGSSVGVSDTPANS